MSKAICTIPDCPKPVNSHGLCSSHDNRRRRYGDPLGGGPSKVKHAPGTLCGIGECTRLAKIKGMCQAHYLRTRRHLKTGSEPIAEALTVEQRFWSYVDKTEDGCWTWKGSTPIGYGRITVDGERLYAHRYSYETFVGPIPEGTEIDHLCRNRACVRPDHLEPVTHKVNMLRGMAPSAIVVRTKVCREGHSMADESNVYVHPGAGGRRCRTCHLAYGRERYRRQRGH